MLFEMLLDGAGCDSQALGDGRVGGPAGNAFEYLGLARSEALEVGEPGETCGRHQHEPAGRPLTRRVAAGSERRVLKGGPASIRGRGSSLLRGPHTACRRRRKRAVAKHINSIFPQAQPVLRRGRERAHEGGLALPRRPRLCAARLTDPGAPRVGRPCSADPRCGESRMRWRAGRAGVCERGTERRGGRAQARPRPHRGATPAARRS